VATTETKGQAMDNEPDYNVTYHNNDAPVIDSSADSQVIVTADSAEASVEAVTEMTAGDSITIIDVQVITND
jgi:hypothetical protein